MKWIESRKSKHFDHTIKERKVAKINLSSNMSSLLILHISFALAITWNISLKVWKRKWQIKHTFWFIISHPTPQFGIIILSDKTNCLHQKYTKSFIRKQVRGASPRCSGVGLGFTWQFVRRIGGIKSGDIPWMGRLSGNFWRRRRLDQ